MKINIKEFKKREQEGYIKCQKHTTLDLFIWNYSVKTQYENHWDEYTCMARGLITDSEGNIAQRPFLRFWNLNEREDTKIENLPVELPEITVKQDGSLGIQYYNGEDVCIATRGSFVSEQAHFATAWVKDKGYKKSDFKEGYTYLYEIIYKENRVVVDYGDKKELILLAVKNIETGKEINHITEALRLHLSFTKKMKFVSMEHLLDYVKNMTDNEEGFVLRYSNGKRIKCKSETYFRLHRLLTSFSSKSIWECLKNKQDLEKILKEVPDEFYKWTKKQEKILQTQFDTIHSQANKVFNKVKTMSDRKTQAQYLTKHHKDICGLVFNLLDSRDIFDNIWKIIKPAYEKPFIETENDVI